MSVVHLGSDSSGRSLDVDDRTLAKLRSAEKALGIRFTIVQGSYRAGHGAAASADTHDRGGVIDLRSWNIPESIGIDRALVSLRRAGLIAWYRTKAQGFDPHIHCVDYGNPSLSPGAGRQVAAWEAGRNGLASGGRDDGPHVPIPKDPPKEPTLNHIEAGRRLIQEGLHEMRKAQTSRISAWVMIRAVAGALRVGPKS